MKCTSCGDEPQTVGAIKDCRRCQKDGVSAQISDAFPRDTPLAPVVATTNGLENRFLGKDFTTGETEAEWSQPAEVVPIKTRARKVVDAAVATVKRVTKRKGARA